MWFRWSVAGSAALDLASHSVTARDLHISARSMAAGQTFTFTRTAWMSEHSLYASNATIVVRPKAADPIVLIEGGSRSIDVNRSVQLSAVASDPENATAALVCQWTCAVGGGEALYNSAAFAHRSIGTLDIPMLHTAPRSTCNTATSHRIHAHLRVLRPGQLADRQRFSGRNCS